MAVWSDMNGFPEGGFPILANANDMITLGQLYLEPLRLNQYIIDVLGNNRLAGALIIAGALSGVTSISANGAISGLTTIGANNTVTLSHATAPLTLSGADANISMTGFNSSIGSMLNKIKKVFINKDNIDQLITHYEKQIQPHKIIMTELYQPIVDELKSLKIKLDW